MSVRNSSDRRIIEALAPPSWGEASMKPSDVGESADGRYRALTPLRGQILNMLAASERPLGTYEIAASIENAEGKACHPNSVRRALNYLMEGQLAVQVKSLHKFIAAPTSPPHDLVVLICTACMTVEAAASPGLEKGLKQIAADKLFTAQHLFIECVGLCRDCAPQDGRKIEVPVETLGSIPANT